MREGRGEVGAEEEAGNAFGELVRAERLAVSLVGDDERLRQLVPDLAWDVSLSGEGVEGRRTWNPVNRTPVAPLVVAPAVASILSLFSADASSECSCVPSLISSTFGRRKRYVRFSSTSICLHRQLTPRPCRARERTSSPALSTGSTTPSAESWPCSLRVP